jgi:chemotaxis protein MotB
VQRSVTGDRALQKFGAKVEVKVGRDGLRIELVESGPGDVFFPVGSSTMKPAAVIALRLITPALGGTANPVVLEGHTDAARFGVSQTYGNWELSGERANAARRVMEAAGLPSTRVAEVRGLADREPRVAADPYAAANRRITIFLPYTTPAPEAAGGLVRAPPRGRRAGPGRFPRRARWRSAGRRGRPSRLTPLAPGADRARRARTAAPGHGPRSPGT